MDRPEWLTDEAADFYDRHADGLEAAGMLTDRDLDSFALLCELWRLLRTTSPTQDSRKAISWNAWSKQYLQLAKQFGLLPRDRKKSKLEPEPDLEDVLRKKLERR